MIDYSKTFYIFELSDKDLSDLRSKFSPANVFII